MPKSLGNTGRKAPYKHLISDLVRSKSSTGKSRPVKSFIHDQALTYVGNTEKGLQMIENQNEYIPSPEYIAAGLMIQKNGETLVTDAGLFAFAAMIAHDLDAEPGSRKHCLKGFHRALNVARAGGLLEQMFSAVLEVAAHLATRHFPTSQRPGTVVH